MRKRKLKKIKVKKVLKIIIKILLVFLYLALLYLSLALIIGTNWTLTNYGFDSFNQILYTLNTSVTKASTEVVHDFIFSVLLIPLFIVLGSFLFIKIIRFLFRNCDVIWDIKLFGKQVHLGRRLKLLCKGVFAFFPIILLCFSIYYILDGLYIFEYLSSSSKTSDFIELEYVDPEKVNLEFPEQKRNLIYIYLESMEATYTDTSNGGAYKDNLIPELTTLAKENLNFSYNQKVGGAYALYGTTWTTGAIVASTAGVPIKTSLQPNSSEYYSQGVVDGAYSLGDILKDNGYHNYMMVGSDIEFGGRKVYLSTHGNYTMYDYYTAIEEGVIEEDYYVWWGLEDAILFDWAKEKITEASQQDEPFNFTLLTVDTHSGDGYTSDFCEDKFDIPYLNALYCSSSQIEQFVEWIQEQDFYENTTVILTGDHLSMNSSAFRNLPDDYMRSVYNVYINSAIDTDCNKDRIFSTFDYFPTTLASLGVKIQGNRLGLGTNLYSCKKTLSEIYGNSYINDNLAQKSTYYDKHIA